MDCDIRILVAGQSIDGVEAHRIGLVQQVVDADVLMERATELALAIAGAAPSAVTLTKRVPLASVARRTGTNRRSGIG